jgi:hypothetical protein
MFLDEGEAFLDQVGHAIHVPDPDGIVERGAKDLWHGSKILIVVRVYIVSSEDAMGARGESDRASDMSESEGGGER